MSCGSGKCVSISVHWLHNKVSLWAPLWARELLVQSFNAAWSTTQSHCFYCAGFVQGHIACLGAGSFGPHLHPRAAS